MNNKYSADCIIIITIGRRYSVILLYGYADYAKQIVVQRTGCEITTLARRS